MILAYSPRRAREIKISSQWRLMSFLKMCRICCMASPRPRRLFAPWPKKMARNPMGQYSTFLTSPKRWRISAVVLSSANWFSTNRTTPADDLSCSQLAGTGEGTRLSPSQVISTSRKRAASEVISSEKRSVPCSR